MIKPTYTYNAIVNSVYDGDSIRCDIDMGMFTWLKDRQVRINGIDTPEVRGSQKVAGKIVGAYLRSRIEGQRVILKTKKPDKYGRVLADIYIDGENVIDDLIAKGYAKAYDGGKKEEWTEQQLADIIKG